jgi:hypothetical protein
MPNAKNDVNAINLRILFPPVAVCSRYAQENKKLLVFFLRTKHRFVRLLIGGNKGASDMKLMVKVAVAGASLALLTGFAMGLGRPNIHSHVDLDAIAKRMDAEKMHANDSNRIADLAKQSGVPMNRVQLMCDGGKGWGQITAELVLAKQLSRRNAWMYPTATNALDEIERWRGADYNYNELATKFKLRELKAAREIARLDRRA